MCSDNAVREPELWGQPGWAAGPGSAILSAEAPHKSSNPSDYVCTSSYGKGDRKSDLPWCCEDELDGISQAQGRLSTYGLAFDSYLLSLC